MSRAATTAATVATTVAAPAVASLPAGFRAALGACDDVGRSLDDKWRGLLAWLDAGAGSGGNGGAPAPAPAAGSPAATARALFAATASGAHPAAVQAAEDDMRASVFAALLADG